MNIKNEIEKTVEVIGNKMIASIGDDVSCKSIYIDEINKLIEKLNVKKLQHHKDTTLGLWATDKPELINDPKKLLFKIT